MALPSAELPRTAGPGYLHPVAAPLEGVSARRTFGTLISAGRNRISLLRLGASGDFAVCCRAWRLPAAHKKHWSGLPTASSAARPGVGLLPAGGGHEAIPAIAHARQAISRAVAQFATQGLLPAADIASRLSCRRRLHFAACLDTAGAAPCPGLGLLGCYDLGEVTGTGGEVFGNIVEERLGDARIRKDAQWRGLGVVPRPVALREVRLGAGCPAADPLPRALRQPQDARRDGLDDGGRIGLLR